jgi:triacylglycerol lipase
LSGYSLKGLRRSTKAFSFCPIEFIDVLAQVQRFIALLLVAAASVWAAYCLVHASWLLASGGLVLIVAGYAAVIGFEFYLLWRSYSTRRPDRPAASDLLRAWWGEIVVAPRVFLWRQPFCSKSIPDSVWPGGAGGRGVVLIHGFFCNRGLWNPWLQRLRQAGVPFMAVTLEPVLGSIDEYRAPIEAAIARLAQVTGKPPVIVAHSMGGLAVRAWLKQFAGQGRLHRVVTLGTPHRGTTMASHARAANARQMQVGSAWLEALEHGESTQASQAFTCFWSRCDNIVFPTNSATLPGADNRELPATAHVQMVYHPQVFAEVLRLVEASADA